jgi:rRNA maturation RNase YbeY
MSTLFPHFEADDIAEGVFYHSDYPGFSLNEENALTLWIYSICESYSKTLRRIDLHLINDTTLLEINREHLGHDYFTDIITFPYEEDPLEAEVFISIDRVADNARTLELPFETEFLRVVAHGILHLCGLNDKNREGVTSMRKAEDHWLNVWTSGHRRSPVRLV